jgi:hypothetical protein
MSKYFKNISIFQKYLKIPNKRFSFTVMELCTYDLLNCAAIATAKELNTPNFTNSSLESKQLQEARYHFVYFAFNRLNARPKLIQSFIRTYHYPKTVYQVIRRQYERRKDPEHQSNMKCIELAFKESLKTYVPTREPLKHKEGKQMKLFN